MSITVVIPTYNRAHLLLETVPSYLQEGVERIILVDDCSSDGTQSVSNLLSSRYPGKILYIRNDKNCKQTYSKNKGKSLAKTQFVYFGDDDSILVPGSMVALMNVQRVTGADIVGAVALYCSRDVDVSSRYEEYLREVEIKEAESFVDLRRLRFRFDRKPPTYIALPTLQASMLVSRKFYKSINFDLRYGGNCYREETDYVLQAVAAGAKTYLAAEAVQINLPPQLATGGARSVGRVKYETYSLINTYKLLRKHKKYFRCVHKVNITIPLFWYLSDRLIAALKKAVG